MIPHHLDALLEPYARYRSFRFRRVSRAFNATRLDYADAVELTAFVDLVGLKAAAIIFRWNNYARKQMLMLQRHFADNDDFQRLVFENKSALDRETGLAVLNAMIDGGWYRGRLPRVVRLAVLDMRASGMTQTAIAKATSLSLWQIRKMCEGRDDQSPRLVCRTWSAGFV